MTRSAPGRAVLGTAVSVIAIAIVLGSVDSGRALGTLREARAEWITAVVLCIAADVLIRGFRWQRLLAPVKAVRYPLVMSYLLIGYLANNILPARLGELVRSHYAGDREAIPRPTVFGTVVVERVVDTAIVVAIGMIAILMLNVRGIVTSAVIVGTAFTALLVLLLAVAIAAHRLPSATPSLVGSTAGRRCDKQPRGCGAGSASPDGRGRSWRRSCSAPPPGERPSSPSRRQVRPSGWSCESARPR